jgi:hypothetical protein
MGKNSSPAFVAVVTERKIDVFALRVTQQRMWMRQFRHGQRATRYRQTRLIFSSSPPLQQADEFRSECQRLWESTRLLTESQVR